MNQYNKINTNKINLVTEINFPSKWILIASQPLYKPQYNPSFSAQNHPKNKELQKNTSL